jgi:hypothetical protein
MKAWSQNSGRENVMTTLRSYGEVSADRQAALITELSKAEPARDAEVEMALRVLNARLSKK